MTAYYNEIDPYAADWLRNLIAAGHIAPGDVDTRSIEDVAPDDLRPYRQCHFFAGIGVWSYALRLADWPDDREVWTGSCPCQPFSAAGKGSGFADERHLWPAWFHLIDFLRPAVVFGEQVASKDGLGWLDLVQSDLEGANYACGAVDLCAAGVGAPHIRQRLWFVAEPDNAIRRADRAGGYVSDRADSGWAEGPSDAEGRSGVGLVANADGGDAGPEGLQHGRKHGQQQEDRGAAGVALGDASSVGLERRDAGALGHERAPAERAGSVSGFWADADWIACTDGKARPVEPGTFPLAHGAPARVGRLRAYGNAIVAEAAAAVIRAYDEAVLFL